VTIVRFYDTAYIPDGKLTYSVISARINGKWIFVRHRRRNTCEICGGHIENQESSDDAARRELMEETGAVEFSIECIATYSVEKNGTTGYGRLYFAEITSIGDIPDVSEIAETLMLYQLPDHLTYPDIQPHLFRKTVEFLEARERD
jgi:8-oxo-dGTP diphosphatase